MSKLFNKKSFTTSMLEASTLGLATHPGLNRKEKVLLAGSGLMTVAGLMAMWWEATRENTEQFETITNLGSQLAQAKENTRIWRDSDQNQRDKKVALIHALQKLKDEHPELAGEIDPAIHAALDNTEGGIAR